MGSANVRQQAIQAIATARTQSARFWELRATTCLARLWFGQGKRATAGDALASICEDFTDGHEIPDLTQARMLLEKWQLVAAAPSNIAS